MVPVGFGNVPGGLCISALAKWGDVRLEAGEPLGREEDGRGGGGAVCEARIAFSKVTAAEDPFRP